jgi:hypothetical protein
MTELNDAIKLAVNGEFPPGPSQIDGHEFYIRSIKNKNMLKDGETSYFRHEHVGKDDRVFYSIKPNPGALIPYTAHLTRIQFRGPFVKNGFRDIGDRGIDVTDAVKVLAAAGGITASLPGSWLAFALVVRELDIQGFLDGDWVPAAAKVADLIGIEMVRQKQI